MTDPVAQPRFSMVAAVYNVERYLPAFIASVEAQRVADEDLEVVAVDDGSTDGSLDILHDWVRRSRFRVQVFHQPNGGQGSARNLGLPHATGEWITFPDPDDLLEPDYLAIADRFAASNPGLEIMGTQPIMLDEATGQHREHARAAQYAAGDRVVDLRTEPNTYPGGTTISFLRRARVQEVGLEFDTRLRPTLEDVHFAARFLLALDAPLVGILATAHYIYRRRASNDSTMQGAWHHPGRYREVPRLGHLDLLQRSAQRHGSVPEWMLQLIIYDLSWYFAEYDKAESAMKMSEDDVHAFEGHLRQILPYIDPAAVARHTVRKLKPIWRDILGHALKEASWHALPARSRMDRVAELQRVHYRFSGPRPSEAFFVNGAPVSLSYAKTMRHVYFGIPMLSERVLWLPAHGELQIELDGQKASIATSRAAQGRWGLPPGIAKRLFRYARLARSLGRLIVQRRVRHILERVHARLIRAISALPAYRSPFRNAWVLMDRYHLAGDNGERLFEYLRAERPDINAWFVIDGDSPDWARMQAAGHRRLIRHRSFRWRMLMLNAAWLVSSHVDAWVVDPPEITRIHRRRRWRYAFLQHGVTKDDLSRWLNPKNIDLFVTTTTAETRSIVDDDTSYVYTDKEVRQTGMPRYDRLLDLGRKVGEDERDVILISPTWRKWFTMPLQLATRRRELHEALWSSDYLRNWDAILRSTVVAEAARARGLRVVFAPHPEMQPLLEAMSLPDHVEPFPLAGNDAQAMFARCALLVTDYSSVAFDAAYLDRPVVYFQFDQRAILDGGHIGRQGYFKYERDGFGPVVEDVAAAERAIVAAIQGGASPAPEYQARINGAFTSRDGQASARVVAAIEELSRPYKAPAR